MTRGPLTPNDLILWTTLFDAVDSKAPANVGAIRTAAVRAAKAMLPPSEYTPSDAASGAHARYRKDSPFGQLLALGVMLPFGDAARRLRLRGLVGECRRLLDAAVADGGGRTEG